MSNQVGEQNSPDVIGGPESHDSKINDSQRESHGGKMPSGHDDSGANRNPANASPQQDNPFASIISQLSDMVANLNSPPPDTSLARYIGGIGAAIDALNWAKDFSTVISVQKEITNFEMTKMKPGEVATVSVSLSPAGKISIVKLQNDESPTISEEGAKSFRTKIVSPGSFDPNKEVDPAYSNQCNAISEKIIERLVEASKPKPPAPAPTPEPKPAIEHGGGGGKVHHDKN